LWRKLLEEEEKQPEDEPTEEIVEENCENLVRLSKVCDNVNNDDVR
jgi:hypothetical protein